MTTADQYRARAAEFEQRALVERDPIQKTEWHKIATAYERLAELADKNHKGGLLIDISLPDRPSKG
jgi:hypothetical protein